MAAEQTTVVGVSLQFQAALEKWMQTGFKVQDHSPATLKAGEEDTGKSLRMLHIGKMRRLSQGIPIQPVKQEPDDVLHQQWEAQWQDFLKMVDSQQSRFAMAPLSEEPTPWDDAEAFLSSFEQVAEACRWPKEEWVTQLLPALRGEAEQAFSRLDSRDREDYGKVKVAILQEDIHIRERNRQHFRHFCYQEAEGPRGTYNRLQELCQGWLKAKRCTKEQILEMLVLEQFLTVLPPEIQSWVRGNNPESCPQAVTLAEDFLQMQEEATKLKQQRLIPFEEVAAAPVSEADQASPDDEKERLCKEGKEEGDVGDSCPPAELGCFTGSPTKGDQQGMPFESAEETVFQFCDEEVGSDSQCRPDWEQKTIPEVRVDESISGTRVYKKVRPTSDQCRAHAGSWQGNENEEREDHRDISDPLSPAGIIPAAPVRNTIQASNLGEPSRNQCSRWMARNISRKRVGQGVLSGTEEEAPSEDLLQGKRKMLITSEQSLKLKSP